MKKKISKNWEKETRKTIRNWLGDAYPDGLSQSGMPYEEALRETNRTVEDILGLICSILSQEREWIVKEVNKSFDKLVEEIREFNSPEKKEK